MQILLNVALVVDLWFPILTEVNVLIVTVMFLIVKFVYQPIAINVRHAILDMQHHLMDGVEDVLTYQIVYNVVSSAVKINALNVLLVIRHLLMDGVDNAQAFQTANNAIFLEVK